MNPRIYLTSTINAISDKLSEDIQCIIGFVAEIVSDFVIFFSYQKLRNIF